MQSTFANLYEAVASESSFSVTLSPSVINTVVILVTGAFAIRYTLYGVCAILSYLCPREEEETFPSYDVYRHGGKLMITYRN